MTILAKSEQDTNRVNVLIAISDAYRSTNTSLCLEYIEKALELSNKLKFERNVLRSILRKATALSKSGDNVAALKTLNEGEKYFASGKFDINRPEFIVRKGYIEWKSKKNEEAIKTFLKADTAYEIFTTKGMLTKTVIGRVECYHVIARIYASQGEYVKAINYCNKAIELAEKNKEYTSAADAYLILGNIFAQQQSYNKALDCYQKSLEYAKQTNITRMVGGNYLTIGNVYLYQKNYVKAKENYLQALEILEKIRDDISVAYVLANLGEIELANANYKSALDYNLRGLKLAEIFKDPQLMLGSNLNLSEAELALGKLDEAEKHAAMAIRLAQKMGLNDYEWRAKRSLSKIYFQKGKFKDAYLYKDSVMILKDTLVNQQQAKLSLELNEKYQNEKKENEIKLQKLDLQMKDSEIASGKKQRMIVIGILILVVIFLLILFNRFKVTSKQKSIITEQKAEVEEQKYQLQEKQKEILDSLQYAKQIQKLLLANHKLVNETLPDSFIMFKPRDIVSGDFYWAAKKDDRFYLAVCDSTGHGVPGAFMSLLNINFLNEAVMEKNIAEPNEIFNYVRKRLIENISQQGRQDGMDGILLCVNETTKKMSYSAANNAPIVISNKTLSVLDADKMPIGKGEKSEPFKLYDLTLSKGDMIILYTDGYADQFGGPKGKKFKYKPLNDILLKNHELPVLEQEEYLYAEFDKWKGALEQVDDVCILGVRL